MRVIGSGSEPVLFAVTISAGGVLIITLVSLWLRDRAQKRRRGEGEDGADDGRDRP
jgi:hypothetical protein